MQILKDSKGNAFKKIGNTYFHLSTSNDLARIMDALIDKHRETRVRVFLGDHKTGREWPEEFDVTGYLGRSTGTIKIPLLINNRRSLGGPALLDDCILKLQTTSGNVLWSAPNYIPLVWWSGLLPKPVKENGRVYIAGVWHRNLHEAESEKVLHSRHSTIDAAYRLASFMRGDRGNK